MSKSFANFICPFGNRTVNNIGLAVVGLFGVMVLAEQAQASCGDYLVTAEVSHPMDQSGEKTRADVQMPLGTPCHGPQCRQSPAIPIPPLPIQSAPSDQDRAHLRRLSEFNLPSVFWYRVVETPARSTPGFPFRLERPPHA